ncbi:hypothetical protein PMAYCL1PPCAC_09799 [Pristionchus mayeri]|uniref:Uncharacterized protein n=1 Tax=Pristionchus mayeri TaxID=1317129 RepID=A0AAN5CE87_9BILA|nr:hypothetical protein PMAYCL1PPCAC_09799 [Pristionchus mayeri]
MLGIYSFIRFFVENKLKTPLFNLHFGLVACCGTLLNLVVLISHDTLHEELLRVTRTQKLFGRKLKTDDVTVRSVNGVRLNVPKGQETAAYFRSYQNIWNQ